MKRIFISINPPEKTKDKIAAIIGKLKKQTAAHKNNFRFYPRKTWHMTVLFLGNQNDKELETISNLTGKAAGKFKKQEAEFDKLVLMPAGKDRKMIWLKGSAATSKIFSPVKKELEKQLTKNRINFSRDFVKFSAHMTLAKINNLSDAEIRKIKLPEIAKMNFCPASMDVMESRQKPGQKGPDYKVLAKLDFKKSVC